MPPIPPPVRRPGLWRATPPAIFPPVMGLFGLGLGWRQGGAAFGFGPGLGEMILGAVTLLYLFCLLAWLAKPARRIGVVAEELKVLPGRAGLAAMALSGYLLAAAALPHGAGLALALMLAALVLHVAVVALVLRTFARGPAEQRRVNPVWHLTFVGFILMALTLVPLGRAELSQGIFWAMVVVAALIWGASARQFLQAGVPAPLRPLLAVHVAPAALFATVAASLGQPLLATGFGLVALALLVVLALSARWLTAAGFSPLWGAFTFPLAATANACFAIAHAGGGELWRTVGGLVLIGATLVVPPIAAKVLQLWAKGQLAPKTAAAVA